MKKHSSMSEITDYWERAETHLSRYLRKKAMAPKERIAASILRTSFFSAGDMRLGYCQERQIAELAELAPGQRDIARERRFSHSSPPHGLSHLSSSSEVTGV